MRMGNERFKSVLGYLYEAGTDVKVIASIVAFLLSVTVVFYAGSYSLYSMSIGAELLVGFCLLVMFGAGWICMKQIIVALNEIPNRKPK